MKVEYRVRPTTRYTITRFESNDEDRSGAVETKGQYDNAAVAYEVAYALCRAEHERLGYPPGDERIQYPVNPAMAAAAETDLPVYRTVADVIEALSACPHDHIVIGAECGPGVHVVPQLNSNKVLIGSTHDERRTSVMPKRAANLGAL